jgi:hypothetical protein
MQAWGMGWSEFNRLRPALIVENLIVANSIMANLIMTNSIMAKVAAF